MEIEILNWIQNNIRCGFLDIVMPLITKLGDSGILWIILAIVLMIIPKTRRLGVTMAVALVIELLICDIILKPLVMRPRPYTVNPDVDMLVKKLNDYSFPSGHTGASFASAFALIFSKNSPKKLWIPAIVLAVIIAFSRLYLYVHYPTDVLAGMVIGTAEGFVASLICRAKPSKDADI